MTEINRRKKVLLFYNPNAGNGMFKNYLDYVVERYQEKDMQLVPVRADRQNIFELAMNELRTEEYKQIAVAGGDGTIHICVNSMIKNHIDLPVAIFPTGTANDFAYYFSMPSTIEEMLDIATGEHTIPVDIGVCNDKYFINVAAMGTLVDVSQKTDPSLKNTLGIVSYYLTGLTKLVNLRSIPVTLKTNNEVYEENMYFMLVMNGKSAGGFKKISPASEISDGELDVILFKDMPRYELGPLFFNVMQGSHSENKNVLYFKTDKLEVTSSQPIPTDVDGEPGEELPLRFSVLHKKLRIHTEESKDEAKQDSQNKRNK